MRPSAALPKLLLILLLAPAALQVPRAFSAPEDKAAEKPSRLTRDESEKQADRREILLGVGEERVIDIDFKTSVDESEKYIRVANKTIALPNLVKLGDDQQLSLSGLKAGETTIYIRSFPEGSLKLILTVKVTASNIASLAEELRSLLRDIDGIEIKISGQKIIIDGEVLVPNDYGRLLSVITDKVYVDQVLNLATLSPVALQVLGRKIQEDIKAFAPGVTVRVVNGLIFLEGTADDIDQANRAVKVASLYLPELKPGSQLEKDPTVVRPAQARPIVNNFIQIKAPPAKKAEKLVRVTVYFVELSKDYNKVFLFKWQPGFTADPQITIGTRTDGGVGAQGATFSATISSLLPKLQSAQNAGYARILKTGNLITRSGQAATLREQTEFPFVFAGPNGTVQGGKQPVGLSIGVTPTILQNDDVALDLNLSQINLVGQAPAGGAAPITASHDITTKLYIKVNESAAVAGVSSQEVGTDFNKDPGSAGGPADPIFTVIRGKSYRKKNSQFVIFVTPQVIENASDGTEDLKKNFRARIN
jgi:pilus assembly protein CpaC